MKTRNTRKNRKPNKGVRTLILPFTVSQDYECFLINLFDHEENVDVKGLWAKQDTILDLVENLPKYLRWMKKSKHRSLGICIRDKEGVGRADCLITHATGRLFSNHSKFTAHARPMKPNN